MSADPAVRDVALNAGDITKVGVGVIIALVVLGFVLSLVITAIVGRIIILVAVVVLGVIVWQQRTSIENKIKNRDCNFSFFGVQVDPPDNLKQFCANKTG
jgi:protein-S-isoprenylcysteine O-methyltransferase Ste14